VHHIFVGFACNNRCAFCAQGDLRSRVPPGDFAEADLGGVAEGGDVAFVGGEPTLFDELPGWVTQARAHGAAEVLVQTNGRRLGDASYVARLKAAGVTRLDVSLHGATAPMHDFHTAMPGSFEESTLGIRTASAGGLGVGVTTVVTRANFRHLQEIVRLAAALGARAVHLAVTRPLGSAAAVARMAAPAEPAARAAPPAVLLRSHWARALAAARTLELPCAAAGADPQTVRAARAWFAGIGVIDTAASS
jgi:MoaA/NifB/PqqE/SkfB family radical SAM enzyme